MASQAQIGVYTPQESAEGAMPRRATPELSGVSTGEGITRIGAALSEIEHQNGAVYASQTLGDARAKFTQRLLDAQTNYKSGDDVVGTIGKEFADYRDQAIKQTTNPYAKRFLKEQLNSLGSEVTEQAMRFQAGAQVTDRISKAQDGVKNAAVAVGIDPSQYPTARAEQLMGISQLQVDPKEKVKLATEATSQMAWSASVKLATDHPDQVLEALQKQDAGHPALNDLTAEQRQELTRYAAAQSNDVRRANEEKLVEGNAQGVLDVYRTGGPMAGAKALQTMESSGLSDEQKDKVRSKILTGINQIRDEARQAHGSEIAGIEERISNGTAGESDRARLQALFHANAYSADQYGAALGGIDRAEKEAARKQQDLAIYADAYSKSTPLAPNDEKVKKGIDTLFQDVTKGTPAGSPEWANRAIDISAKTGVVPTSASEWGLANLVSGKPEQAASAALLLQRIYETNPRGAPFAVGEKEHAMAAQISEATEAGTDPETAVTMARENAKLSSAQRQMLDDQWKSQTGYTWKQGTAAMESSAIRKGLADDPHYNPPGLFAGSVPQPPLAMGAEYAHLVRDYFYHTGGNVKQAQKLAIDDLKSTWGVSEVNGPRELMKYAPERMFPGLTPAFIHRDIKNTLQEAKVDATGDVRLAESSETGSSGGRIWNLVAPDKFGAYETLRDKDGLPLRYALPDVDREGDQYRADIAKENQDRADLAQLVKDQRVRNVQRAMKAVL